MQGFEAAIERPQKRAEAGVDVLLVEAATRDDEIRVAPAPGCAPAHEHGDRRAHAHHRCGTLGQLGNCIVSYANAALQGAVAGMQNALGVLRDDRRIDEDPALVVPFSERQRLVGKPALDALEARYRLKVRSLSRTVRTALLPSTAPCVSGNRQSSRCVVLQHMMPDALKIRG